MPLVLVWRTRRRLNPADWSSVPRILSQIDEIRRKWKISCQWSLTNCGRTPSFTRIIALYSQERTRIPEVPSNHRVYGTGIESHLALPFQRLRPVCQPVTKAASSHGENATILGTDKVTPELPHLCTCCDFGHEESQHPRLALTIASSNSDKTQVPART